MPEPINVLIVEDDADQAFALKQLLEIDDQSSRCICVVAGSLAEAKERLLHDRPEIVLLDLSLPDSRGPETVRAVFDAAPQIPIIVLSGVSEKDAAVAALRFGAQHYFEKPNINARELKREMVYAIERTNKAVRDLNLLDMMDQLKAARHTIDNILEFVNTHYIRS